MFPRNTKSSISFKNRVIHGEITNVPFVPARYPRTSALRKHFASAENVSGRNPLEEYLDECLANGEQWNCATRSFRLTINYLKFFGIISIASPGTSTYLKPLFFFYRCLGVLLYHCVGGIIAENIYNAIKTGGSETFTGMLSYAGASMGLLLNLMVYELFLFRHTKLLRLCFVLDDMFRKNVENKEAETIVIRKAYIFIVITNIIMALKCAFTMFILDEKSTFVWRCADAVNETGCILWAIFYAVSNWWGMLSYSAILLPLTSTCFTIEFIIETMIECLKRCINYSQASQRANYQRIVTYHQKILEATTNFGDAISPVSFLCVMHFFTMIVIFIPALMSCDQEARRKRYEDACTLAFYCVLMLYSSWRGAQIHRKSQEARLYLQKILVNHYLASPETVEEVDVLFRKFSCTVIFSAAGFFDFTRAFLLNVATGTFSYVVLIYQLNSDSCGVSANSTVHGS